jgi:D-glycero-alpha-D-manno-heptose-7-phosphate kinase
MYVTVNKRFDDTIRVSYSKTEIVNHLGELRHELVREALRMVGTNDGPPLPK